ncbi:MAG: DNA gyrase subunit A [Bacillota bacterium]
MDDQNSLQSKTLPVDLEREMRKSYIDYAMSVIVSRALPDVRDGLKPVHRRILYAMYDAGNTPDKAYRKSAKTVGEVLGNFHPHGDQAVYDAMVRMAQDFAIRYPLVDGHGNFGSMDGDPPAAMRYTEARLSKMALAMLADIDKETVDFDPNFDNTDEEPKVLPSRIPNLLVNGSEGIAVGMATKIPPHNLREVIDGVIMLIDNPAADVKDLMQVIKGPDFPTGALIMGREGIRDAYTTGRGSITMRAVATIEPMNNGKSRIVVTEIPYQVNKARLIEQIAELVRDKKIDGITDLRDETDRHGMRIVVELRRDANPNVILNQLYKFTPMQSTFGAIMLSLVDSVPKVLNLREMLYYYLQHQKDVVTRRSRYDLRKAEERAHILEGLRIALDHIDEVINLIRASRTEDDARQGLMARFGLSEVQAKAIVDMRLGRLTGLERDKIEQEYAELLKTMDYLRALLSNERMLMTVIKKELSDVRDKYGDDRRTKITASEAEEFALEDLIPEEDMVVTLTHAGYIKRLPLDTYRSQRRGGRGVTGMGTKEEDFVEHIFVATTHHSILVFTNRGKVYKLKVHQVPEAGRTAKGTAIVNLLQISPGEKIQAVIPVKGVDEDHFLFFATQAGTVKKTRISEYANIRAGGLIAVGLEEQDELVGVRRTDGNSEIILVSARGQAIRFKEEDVRAMGRSAHGVRGMNLDRDDVVIGMDVADDTADLLVVTDQGFGKRTPVKEYRLTGRGGKGVRTMNLTRRNGNLVGIRSVREDDELILITANGVLIRIAVREVSQQGRDTQGVTVMRPDEGDKVVALALVPPKEEDEGTDGAEETADETQPAE